MSETEKPLTLTPLAEATIEDLFNEIRRRVVASGESAILAYMVPIKSPIGKNAVQLGYAGSAYTAYTMALELSHKIWGLIMAAPDVKPEQMR